MARNTADGPDASGGERANSDDEAFGVDSGVGGAKTSERPSFAEHAGAHTESPVFALLQRYLPERRTVFSVAVVATIGWRLANLAAPYLLGLFVDAFLVGGSLSVAFLPDGWIPPTTREQFGLLLGLFVIVSVANVGANAVRIAVWRWFQQSVMHELRVETYQAVSRLDVAFFEAEQTGDVMSVLNNDVNQLREFLNDGLQRLLQSTAFFLALLAAMLALHWQLTLVVFALVPTMVGLVAVYSRAVEPRYDRRRAVVGRLNARIGSTVEGIETVKAAPAEDTERERLETDSRAFWRADWAAAKLAAVFQPAKQAISVATMVVVVGVGGSWLLFGPPGPFDRPLSAGTFVVFYFYSQMVVGQSSRLGDVADSYVDASASAKRVLGLLHYPGAENRTGSEVNEGGTDEPTSLSGPIEYQDVTFTYSEADAPAIRNVSFTVDDGAFVGLVGPTGAGKSTVLKLLLRFYEPDTGRITTDGVDIDAVPAERVREGIGYVGQEPFLFDGTVRENISYGSEPVDDAAVVEAAKAARAHQFITDFRDGYDTEIGERGVTLSGGQRQRLAITRAVVDDPAILLLDEATSHVDNRTELLLQESLATLREGRTTIAVAHRLSTVREADRLLVFEDGRVVENGAHEELLAAEGLYASLWRLHVGESTSPAGNADALSLREARSER